jgi:hypothetical protein
MQASADLILLASLNVLIFVSGASAFAYHPVVSSCVHHARRINLRPDVTFLKCSTASPQEANLIVPTALKEIGGGWTIQGLKPPPKQGTVWARPRPKVGEVQKMGSGSFGTIYLGTDLLTGAEVAVKAEPDFGQKESPLKAEAEILIELQDGPGTPQVYWVGQRPLNGQVLALHAAIACCRQSSVLNMST